MPKAKSVKIDQVIKFLAENEDYTWLLTAGNWANRSKRPGARRIKYLTLTLDTRTMDIHRLEVSGSGKGITVLANQEEFNGDLLELLEKKFSDEG